MRIAELAGCRVAVWGFGREARAVLRALRARLPAQDISLLCGAAEVESARAFDPALRLAAGEPDAATLGAFDVVVKSPGISAYRPELLAARAGGTRFTSGTALWFAENPEARVVGVTGTKGKSTTSALIAHLARALGVRTALAGNIGLPLLQLLGQPAVLWVVELSSFQTGDAGPLELGVVTSLYEEHLDWHGTLERYVADKLRMAAVSRRLLVNAGQPLLLERTRAHPARSTFGPGARWHLRDGWICRDGQRVFDAARLPMPGVHNAGNACAALAALELVGLDALAAAPALADFRPLPHRLHLLGERDGRAWVDDSISTTPQATLAALESLQGRAVAVLVGGYDRGLDWTPFVEHVRAAPPAAIVCMGANGARIAAALQAARVACPVTEAVDLADAVATAGAQAPPGGVVLLSPGAPSFDRFRNYAERGRAFAILAGFDGGLLAEIPGLGIA